MIKLDPVGNIVVRWAAMLYSRYAVATDGRTVYERRRGRTCKLPVIPFGEKVWYLKSGSLGKDKFNNRWEEGVWLGISDDSAESIIGTTNGTIKAKDFKRTIIEADRWNK